MLPLCLKLYCLALLRLILRVALKKDPTRSFKAAKNFISITMTVNRIRNRINSHLVYFMSICLASREEESV
jgi:hypothetical protein